MSCNCANWGDRVRISLGHETADLLHSAYDIVRARNAWLDAARCRTCGAHWYVAVDTIDDDYYFRRLSPGEMAGIIENDYWPDDFDNFVNVWPLEDKAGHGARLSWPWKDGEFEVR
jgi:hypothetical protein